MERDDLEILLRSRVPLVVIESRDEMEVIKALTRACAGSGGLPLFQWTVTDGLKRLDLSGATAQRTLTEPIDILKHIRATGTSGAYALLDFHPYMNNSTLVRLIKDIAQEYPRCPRTVVLISYAIDIPHEIEHLAARCNLALPDRNERRQIVEDVARQWMRENARQSIKQHTAPTAAMVRSEIAATHPLAVVMAEKVGALRAWAEGRTVGAG